MVNDTEYTLRATAMDALGNLTPCSTTSLRYIEDRKAPFAPVLTRTEPASPASDPTPNVVGPAEPGARVRIYTADTCSGTPAAKGIANVGLLDLHPALHRGQHGALAPDTLDGGPHLQ